MVHAWLMLMIIGVNFLNVGMHVGGSLSCAYHGPASEAQLEALSRMFMDADDLCDDLSARIGGTNWAEEVLTKKVQYDGSTVAKAVDLSLEQLLPALPPADLSGRVDAAEWI